MLSAALSIRSSAMFLGPRNQGLAPRVGAGASVVSINPCRSSNTLCVLVAAGLQLFSRQLAEANGLVANLNEAAVGAAARNSAEGFEQVQRQG